MAQFKLLRLLVVFLGGVVTSSVLAALATSDINLPLSQEDTHHRYHSHQKDGHAHQQKSSSDEPPVAQLYHKEHELTETSARQYVADMKESDFRAPSWCKQCNATTLRYCRSQLFLNDHCCCEYSHANEQLPWISHTCHRKLEAVCTVNAGSCSKYRAIKECCCDLETKLEFKNKYSTGSIVLPARILVPLTLLSWTVHRFATLS
ncbi:uncharacterized protein LOC126559998 [Anopheles maculipalpis]|uniref:uncharacterized protein LOC126559998 n=1 Tax=Anopheles maculipalpis TaxID=1496333 RepID=UPI0021592E5C|nr:uncharacterized protein LOC126559998 [Anopheles maculipalpis]